MRRAIVLFSFLLAVGCSMDRSAGGTAETENSASARQFDVDSLLPECNRPSGLATVAILRLDSANFPFDSCDPTGRDLDVRRLDGSSLPFEIAYWDRTARLARLRTRIEPALRGNGSKIAVWRGLDPAGRTDPAAVWSGISDSQRLAITSVLVDDFEGDSLTTRLPDSSKWFVATGGTGTGVVALSGARTGHALRVVSTSTSGTPSSLAAALLASTPRALRTIDTLSFWAKGSGRILASLERAGAGVQKVAWTSRTLDTTWRLYRIAPGEFDTTAITSNTTWESVRDSVTHVSFWMAGTGELWLDDVRISGIDRDDLR
jgi:hypothetical protein